MNQLINLIARFDFFLQSKKGLRLIVFFIISVNALLYVVSNENPFSPKQARWDAVGFSEDKAQEFSYFYFYTGYFPLGTLNKDIIYSKEGAENEIEKRGDDLIMEYQHWSRLGESARILAYLPNAYLADSVKNPSIKLFNTIIFAISLIIMFFGFWKTKKALFGCMMWVMINFTPFFLFEIYSRENIFGLLATTFLLILGLNVKMIFSKSVFNFGLILIAVFSGSLIGFFSEFRNEISIVIVSLILLYVLSKEMKIFPKIILAGASVFFFWLTKTATRSYFDYKFEAAYEIVNLQKGHVYDGTRISGHNFWHPVFCGLGDFDIKYGYEWNDIKAYEYAIPILNKKYGMNILYSGKSHTDNYYDDAKLYYKKPEELPYYEEVMKEKVLSDIKNDPLWYATIIAKRIFRTLTRTIPIPYVGLLIFPLIYFLVKRKDWSWVKLIVLSLPLSATSIIVHSGKGATYNSLFVYFVLSIIGVQLYQYYRNNINV